MTLFRFSVLGLALLGLGLTADVSSACCMGGVSKPSTPNVRPHIHVPRPDASGAARSAVRDARDAASRNAKGMRSGKAVCKNCGCPECEYGGEKTEARPSGWTDAHEAAFAQDVVATRAWNAYERETERLNKAYAEAAARVPGLAEQYKLYSDLLDAKLDADEITGNAKKQYLEDPSAENDQKAKAAEAKYLQLETAAREARMKRDVLSDRVWTLIPDAKKQYDEASALQAKEYEKWEALSAKIGQGVGKKVAQDLLKAK